MSKLVGAVSSATVQGGRSHQEDRYVVESKMASDKERGWLLAVADGHGSSRVSEFCRENLGSYLEQALGDKQTIDEAVVEATFRAVAQATEKMETGSTLSFVYVSETQHKANVAVIGDSPVIIRAAGGQIIVSPNHNARENEKERRAAIARGGIYEDGYIWDYKTGRGLQMCRGLGDWPMSFVSHEPDVYSVPLNSESFVLIVSDGVSDPGHSDDGYVEYLTAQVKEGAEAKDLVADAVARKTRDNATAILWRVS